MWFAALGGAIFSMPFLNHLLPDQRLFSPLLIANVLFLIGIPVLSIIALITRLLFKVRLKRRWKIGMNVLWGLNIVSLFLIASFTSKDFRAAKTTYPTDTTFGAGIDTLNIFREANAYKDVWFGIGDHLKFDEDKLIVNQVYLSFEKSPDNSFHIRQENNSRGESISNAGNLADAINYETQLDAESGNLTILPNFILEEGEKWRDQEVDIILQIPEGKIINFPETQEDGIYFINIRSGIHPARQWGKGTWEMTANGLQCLDCLETGHELDEQYLKPFEELHLIGDLKVTVHQSHDHYVKMRGRPHYTEQVEITQMGELLTVVTDLEDLTSPVRVDVFTSDLSKLLIKNTDDVKVKGFALDRLDLEASGKQEIKLYADTDSLYLKQSDYSKVDLYGNYNYLNAYLLEHAKLDGEKVSIYEANIVAEKSSRASVAITKELQRRADESSSIRVEGNPSIKELEQ